MRELDAARLIASNSSIVMTLIFEQVDGEKQVKSFQDYAAHKMTGSVCRFFVNMPHPALFRPNWNGGTGTCGLRSGGLHHNSLMAQWHVICRVPQSKGGLIWQQEQEIFDSQRFKSPINMCEPIFEGHLVKSSRDSTEWSTCFPQLLIFANFRER